RWWQGAARPRSSAPRPIWRAGSRPVRIGREHCPGRGRVTSVTAQPVDVLIKRLDTGLPLPTRAHPGDAGVDLCAAVDVTLAPGERAGVPTGVSIGLPDGDAAFVHP